MSLEELRQRLSRWDGKSVADLETIYRALLESKNHSLTDIQQQLIALLEDVTLQTAASWLLKRAWEQNNLTPSAAVSKKIIHALPLLETWETKLHILQSLPHLPLSQSSISKTESKKLYAFLHKNLSAENKFVRAWTYHGFYELALNYPSYTEEVKLLFRRAMLDEAASVKARIRNIVKSGFALES